MRRRSWSSAGWQGPRTFHHLLHPEYVARSDFESLIGGTGDAPQTGASAATAEQMFDRLKDEFYMSREFDAHEWFKTELDTCIMRWNATRHQKRLAGTPKENSEHAPRRPSPCILISNV